MKTQIHIGKEQVSMMNPPGNYDTCLVAGRIWNIGRNYQGLVVLRNSGECHPDFINGMDMLSFAEWINSQLV